ncbi:MAG: hypothetical protein V3T17_19240 [Pseudomonadales bacterium]
MAVGAYLIYLANEGEKGRTKEEGRYFESQSQETFNVQVIVEQRDAEDRRLDEEEVIAKVIEARQQNRDMLVSVKEGIPNILNVRGLQLCKHITIFRAKGMSEEVAIREVLRTYLNEG